MRRQTVRRRRSRSARRWSSGRGRSGQRDGARGIDVWLGLTWLLLLALLGNPLSELLLLCVEGLDALGRDVC